MISGYSKTSNDGSCNYLNGYLLFSGDNNKNFIFGVAVDYFEDGSFGDVLTSFGGENPDVFELVFEVEEIFNEVLEFFDPFSEHGGSGVEILDDDVSFLDALFVGDVVHEIEEGGFLGAVNEGVLSFGELFIEFYMLGALLKDIVEHVHIVAVNSFGAEHVNDRDGEDEEKNDDETEIAEFDKGFGGLLLADGLGNDGFKVLLGFGHWNWSNRSVIPNKY